MLLDAVLGLYVCCIRIGFNLDCIVETLAFLVYLTGEQLPFLCSDTVCLHLAPVLRIRSSIDSGYRWVFYTPDHSCRLHHIFLNEPPIFEKVC